MDSVVFVQSIAASLITKHLQVLCINIFYALCYFCERDAFAASDEEWYFVECYVYIMNSFCEDFFGNGSVWQELDEFHFFWKVNVAASCVLFVYRGDHDLVSEDELVFYADRHLVVRVNKAKRFEVHVIVQCSFHVLAVQIRYKTISGINNIAEIFDVFELVAFLFSCSGCCVVTH